MQLEIAVETLADAIAAARHADRLELCSSLDRHGMTPGVELVEAVTSRVGVPVHALIRERESYIADRGAVHAMVDAAKRVALAGAGGIVIGALTRGREIDVQACRAMIDAAREIKPRITIAFHRAFDDALSDAGGTIDVARAAAAIDSLVELGVSRSLCSGATGLDHTMVTLDDRVRVIARVRDLALGRLSIVACGGVRADNAQRFLAASGGEIHASCRVEGALAEDQARLLASVLRAC